MNNKDEDLKRQLHLTMQKSHRLLKTARLDFKSGDYDSASSRAYYAVFHVMEGALLLKGLTYSKHSAVISAFNLHFFIRAAKVGKQYRIMGKELLHVVSPKLEDCA
jgi:uncharacterized protein (UPF0332 family)